MNKPTLSGHHHPNPNCTNHTTLHLSTTFQAHGCTLPTHLITWLYTSLDKVNAMELDSGSDVDGEWNALFENSFDALPVPKEGPPDGAIDVAPKTKKKRGRPLGHLGSSLLRQELQNPIEEEHGKKQSSIERAREARARNVAMRKEQRALAASSGLTDHSAAECGMNALVEFGPMQMLVEVGQELHQDLARAYVKCCQEQIGPEDPLVEHQLDSAMSSMSARVLEDKVKETGVRLRVISIASAMLEYCAYLWATFLFALQRMWSSSESIVQPIAFIVRLRYDETPTRVRVQDSTDEIVNLESASLQQLAEAMPSEAASLHAKIMQVEMSLSMLLYNSRAKQFNAVQGIMPTTLFAVQSTTGQNTLKCLEQVLRSIPGLKDVADDPNWTFSLRHTCTDKYAANISAERGLSEIWSKQPLVHLFCDIHKLYNATKSSMSVADADASGLLALTLGWSESGSVATFRQALCKIFSRKLVVYYSGEAPIDVPRSKAAKYKEDLFNLFLPLTGVSPARAKQHEVRRFVIQRLMNGHLYRTDEVQHYCKYNCCENAEATLRTFAVWCCWALVPCQAPVFPRSRWTRWDAANDWAGLIEGCHGLLSQLIAEVTGAPTSENIETSAFTEPEPQKMVEDGEMNRDEWDALFAVSFDQQLSAPVPAPAPRASESGPVQQEEPVGDEPEDWAKKKQQSKKKAALWLQSRPFHRLAIIKPVAALLLSLMYKFLQLGGPSFEKKQQVKVASGKQQEKSFPVLEALRGKDVEKTLNGMLGLLYAQPEGIVPEAYTAKLKSQKFRMVSAGMTSIHILLRLPRSTCPFLVFAALEDGGAKRLLDVPSCMHDALADKLLKKYVPWQSILQTVQLLSITA